MLARQSALRIIRHISRNAEFQASYRCCGVADKVDMVNEYVRTGLNSSHWKYADLRLVDRLKSP